MLSISREQLNNRYDSLPQELKELLFSETNSDLLWTIGDVYHLSDAKKSDLAALVGDVILGFVHPDDLAKHIVPDLGIDARLAQSLAAEIEKKIFASFLTELRQNYKGMAATAPTAVSSEITKTELVYKEPEQPAMVLKEEPRPAELKTYFDQLNGKAPVVKGGKQIEVEKREIQAAPVIIHTETEAKPIAKVKSSFGGLMGIFSGGNGKNKEEAVAAEVQFSKSTKNETERNNENKTINKIGTDTQRTVHYTALRTPLTDLQLKASETPVSKSGDFVPKIVNLESIKIVDKKEITPLNQWLLEKEGNKAQLQIQSIAEFLNQKAPFIKGGKGDLITQPFFEKRAGVKLQPISEFLKQKEVPVEKIVMGDLKKEINHPNPLLERGQITPESLDQWLNKKTGTPKEDHEKLIAEELAKLQVETKAKKSGGFFGFFTKTRNNAEQTRIDADFVSPKTDFVQPKAEIIKPLLGEKVVEKNFTEGDLGVNQQKMIEKIIQEEKSPNPVTHTDVRYGANPLLEIGQQTPFIKGGKGDLEKIIQKDLTDMDLVVAKKQPKIQALGEFLQSKSVKPEDGAESEVKIASYTTNPQPIEPGQINQAIEHEDHKKIVESHINQAERESIIGNIADVKVNMGKPEILQQNISQPAVSPVVEQVVPQKLEKQIQPGISPVASPEVKVRPEVAKQPEPDISKIELKHLPVEEDIIDLRNL